MNDWNASFKNSDYSFFQTNSYKFCVFEKSYKYQIDSTHHLITMTCLVNTKDGNNNSDNITNNNKKEKFV